jgi:hypothetical protein
MTNPLRRGAPHLYNKKTTKCPTKNFKINTAYHLRVPRGTITAAGHIL